MNMAPQSSIDIFSDEEVTNPWPSYAKMRSQGPVVFLEKYDAFAVTRHQEAKAMYTSPATFISGKGVGLNDPINEQMAGTIIAADGDDHMRLRKIATSKLTLPSMRALENEVQHTIDAFLDEVLGDGPFNAVERLARRIPVEIVGDLIGMDEEAKANIVQWAELGFNNFGPITVPRTLANIENMEVVFEYAFRVTRPGGFKEGSLGAMIVEAMEAGALSEQEGPQLLVGYLSGGIDTTVAAIGNMLETLEAYPEKFTQIKAQPDLIPNAVDELLRRTPSALWFAREAAEDTELGGVQIPKGSRVIPLIGSVNRDPQIFEKPDQFEPSRKNARQHVAFGFGRHVCAGQFIAKLELECFMRALCQKAEAISIHRNTRKPNNVIYGHDELTVELH